MALITCPECGKEISDKAKICVHCGYKKSPKTLNKKQLLLSTGVVCIVTILFLGLNYVHSIENYPNLMKLLTQSYVSDVLDMLGDNYETDMSTNTIFYTYTHHVIDDIYYDEIHVAESITDGSLRSITIVFYIDELSKIDAYVSDITKHYGDYKERENETDSYSWVTANSLNPYISIHKQKNSYKIYLELD